MVYIKRVRNFFEEGVVRIRIGIFALTAMLLQACAMSDGKSSSDAAEADTAPAYVAEQGLSEKERFRKVLYLLEQGEPVPARAELIVYLQQQPDSEIGNDLLEQIDLPAASYFPLEYREIQLQSGVSLSNVSKYFLGSVYKFHALAKYNGIAEPGSLTVGQIIRIPLTAEALEAFEAQEQAVQEQAVQEHAAQDESSPEGDAVDGPQATGQNRAESGNAEPESVLIEAPSATAAIEPVATQVETLHRQALNAYRAQDLDTAIDLWNQVLELDPEYENARLYRSQAIELKKKLSSFN